jgi:quercetin dioxygenase-like cupin family protein
MKEKSVTLVLFATLVLTASGQDEIRDGSTHEHPTEASMAAHQGLTHAGPAAFKPEFENEAVEVVRITIGPHAKLPMHDLTPRVVVLLTDQDLRLTFPNGETREEHHKAGETMWVSPERHAGENLTDKPIEFIAVIPKQK